METVVLYHAISIDKLSSVMKYGLIGNFTDAERIYFCNIDTAALDWIKWREVSIRKRPIKKLGLVIFETNIDDPLLEIPKDGTTELLQSFGITRENLYVYNKSITPDRLKFEECYFDGDDYECIELKNIYKYTEPNIEKKVAIAQDGYRNIISYYNGKPEFEKDVSLKMIKGLTKYPFEEYKRWTIYWKEQKELK